MHPEIAKARAHVAGLHARPETDPELIDARRRLSAAKIQSFIEKQLRQAPPLTDEQRGRLAELLRPVRRELGADARGGAS